MESEVIIPLGGISGLVVLSILGGAGIISSSSLVYVVRLDSFTVQILQLIVVYSHHIYKMLQVSMVSGKFQSNEYLYFRIM